MRTATGCRINGARATCFSAWARGSSCHCWRQWQQRQPCEPYKPGAQRRDIVRLVVGRGLVLIAIGITLGLAAAFVFSRFLSNLLFGISSTDPVTFAAVALILAAMAMLGSYVPAATKVDPVHALRIR